MIPTLDHAIGPHDSYVGLFDLRFVLHASGQYTLQVTRTLALTRYPSTNTRRDRFLEDRLFRRALLWVLNAPILRG